MISCTEEIADVGTHESDNCGLEVKGMVDRQLA